MKEERRARFVEDLKYELGEIVNGIGISAGIIGLTVGATAYYGCIKYGYEFVECLSLLRDAF